MDFLENVDQNKGGLTEVGMKQGNNHEFDDKQLIDPELKYEENHTFKEEENFDEIGNSFEFMETVLVEVKEEHAQAIQYSSDQCEFKSKHSKCLIKRSEHKAMLLKHLLNLNFMLKVCIWV